MSNTKIQVKSIENFPRDPFQYTMPYKKTGAGPEREMFTTLKILHVIGFLLAVNPLKLVKPPRFVPALCNIPYVLLLVFSGLWISFNVYAAATELEFLMSMSNRPKSMDDGMLTEAENSTRKGNNFSSTFNFVSMINIAACASVAVILVLLSHLQYWSLPHTDEFQFSRRLPSTTFSFTVLLVYVISVAVCIYQGVFLGNLFGKNKGEKLLKGLFRTYVKTAAITVAAITALEYGSIVGELRAVLSMVKSYSSVSAIAEVATGVGRKLSRIESIQGLSQMTAIIASFVTSLLGAYTIFYLVSQDKFPNKSTIIFGEVLPVAASMVPFLMLNLTAEYVKGWSSDVKRDLLKNFPSTVPERQRLEIILQDDPFPPALKLSTRGFMNLGNDNITNYFLQLITFFIILIQFQSSETSSNQFQNSETNII